jgi:hypothetical protein
MRDSAPAMPPPAIIPSRPAIVSRAVGLDQRDARRAAGAGPRRPASRHTTCWPRARRARSGRATPSHRRSPRRAPTLRKARRASVVPIAQRRPWSEAVQQRPDQRARAARMAPSSGPGRERPGCGPRRSGARRRCRRARRSSAASPATLTVCSWISRASPLASAPSRRREGLIAPRAGPRPLADGARRAAPGRARTASKGPADGTHSFAAGRGARCPHPSTRHTCRPRRCRRRGAGRRAAAQGRPRHPRGGGGGGVGRATVSS